ncbi:peptidoglycan-associated lipoprotein [Candidatus Regiella insecticola 5.15]|uniref:Peptidoglycan-associated lipoprotein n=1 Tax=Candidatus Regiella insecticola 5.15 TaxID=1005043 RepID=G2H007_9ENTR|nr:peptidoglycan-associated lipoprotein Pal [Candidatus Regiella insecticola]EGY28671.1 peptidoglycan-associated lipoprotein [Candidatus Regiella insecticola 5.15]
MQLNKTLKGLMLVLPILVVTACSSNKHGATDQSAIDPNAAILGTERENLSRGSSREEQMQRLQQKNIIYFGYDKYDISAEFTSILDEHAAFLRADPATKIVIEGHADERGTPEYNIALGERRANAVSMYLQGQGVSNQQISIVSYGKVKPAEMGHDANAYAKNRRAVLVY